LLQAVGLSFSDPILITPGPVDAADFKTCVFPLLFFKRISDEKLQESD